METGRRERSSEMSGFYRLPVEERLKLIQQATELTDEELDRLSAKRPLGAKEADPLLENVLGVFPLPLAIATNFCINGKDRLIPMATEEKSIVAGASYGAKLARASGGFIASSFEPQMIGQIQIMSCPNPDESAGSVKQREEALLEKANSIGGTIVSLGGGAKSLECKVLRTPRGDMLVVDIVFDTKDAMGARFITRACETVAPLIEKITGGIARTKILSNFAIRRVCRARAVWGKDLIGGETIEAILDLYEFALHDKFRCVTHNKGIMNGVDAVAVATGNDFRAIEAAAHAYACRSGEYLPLTKYSKDEAGNLVGEIELPVPVGIVGGATRSNPIAAICLKILNVESATELGEIIASVGLAQNFAIMRALVQEGLEGSYKKLSERQR